MDFMKILIYNQKLKPRARELRKNRLTRKNYFGKKFEAKRYRAINLSDNER